MATAARSSAGDSDRTDAALDELIRAHAGPLGPGQPGDRTDAALDELILAAREVYVVLESHVQLVEQAAREYERDPDPALPGRADVDREGRGTARRGEGQDFDCCGRRHGMAISTMFSRARVLGPGTVLPSIRRRASRLMSLRLTGR